MPRHELLFFLFVSEIWSQIYYSITIINWVNWNPFSHEFFIFNYFVKKANEGGEKLLAQDQADVWIVNFDWKCCKFGVSTSELCIESTFMWRKYILYWMYKVIYLNLKNTLKKFH